MSWERIWIEVEGGGAFLERSDAERAGKFEQFREDLQLLYDEGARVLLVAGMDHHFEQLFLFRDASAARKFFSSGYRDWESFAGDGSEGCGFEEITLHEKGKKIRTKSAAPTVRKLAPDTTSQPDSEQRLPSARVLSRCDYQGWQITKKDGEEQC
jgi:hypothetical protein